MILKKFFFVSCFISWIANVAIAQTNGCTDFQANNYNPNAIYNDGSCTYNSTSYSPVKLVDKLSDTISETSALVYINGELWTLGDSGNPPAIYRFDKTTGMVLQTIYISNASNYDWEDMAVDASNLYIGDFGNNNGNRTDLVVYKIGLSQITTKTLDTVVAQKIRFSYSDQTDYTSRGNANSFDCESMFVWNDTLHLFSKDWVNGHSKHYALSTIPGTYSIQPIDSFDPGCLITGAGFDPLSRRIVLAGYNKTGFCYLWLLWDFNGNKVFSGNKRKIDFGFFTNTGQIEGVCFKDSSNVYITNEKNVINNKLYAANVGQWMNPKSAGINYKKQQILKLSVYPNPSINELTVHYVLNKPGTVSYCIYNTEGKLVLCMRSKINGGEVSQRLNISHLTNGTYSVIVHSDGISSDRKIFIKL